MPTRHRVEGSNEVNHAQLRTEPGTRRGLNKCGSPSSFLPKCCASWHVGFVLLQALSYKAEVTNSELVAFALFGIQTFLVSLFFYWPAFKKLRAFTEKSRCPKLLEKWDIPATRGPLPFVAIISWDSAQTAPLDGAHAHQFMPVPTTP